MIRAATIGAGRRATITHYPAIKRLKEVDLVAACDLDEDLLRENADRFEIPQRFTDYNEMFRSVDIDVVYAVTQPTHIARIALDCLNAGKHVFIEKPPGATADEARQLAQAAETNGKVGAVGFQRRYGAVITAALERINARGGLSTFLVEFHKNFVTTPGPLNVHPMVDDGIHVADLLLFLGGAEVKSVTTSRHGHFTDWVSTFPAHVEFANGALGVFYFIRSAGARYLRYELHGRGISAYVRPPEIGEVFTDDDAKPTILNASEITGSEENIVIDGVVDMHEHFVECVQTGAEPRTSLQGSIASMELLEQIHGPA